MENDEKVGVRELYASVTEDIRFAKRQQWTVAYYLLLVHAGIAGFYRLLGAGEGIGEAAKVVLVVLLILSTLAGVWYLASCQDWMRKNRIRLRRIHEKHTTAEFLDSRGGADIHTGFFRHGFVLVSLTALATASTALVVWYVFREGAFTRKILISVIAASLLILLWHKVSRKA
jgi:hypothetical protein